MKFVLVNLIICILASDFTALGYGISSPLVLEQDQPSQRCKASRTYSLIQVECTNRDLENIPNNLDPKTQVLVLTNNRVRELLPGGFSRYGNLEYLYLDKNVILHVSEESIEELQYLQVLDLSDNVIGDFPPSLFQLPHLRNLYLRKNLLRDSRFQSEVESPLELLDVSKNHLTKMPSIGIQARLITLNLSENQISHISTEDLAPFCSLKTLDLKSTQIRFSPENCDCYHFNSWIMIRNIKVIPSFPCNNATFEGCGREPFSNQTMESYNKCLNIIEVREAALTAKKTWTAVGSCVGVFIVCAIIGFYCMHKRNKKRNRKLKEEQTLAANNANTELLNGNLPDQLSVKTLQE